VLAVHRGATLVPEEAIVPEGDATWVYVVADEHAHRRKVDVGVRQHGRVEVTSGLSGDETVVVSGQIRLRDGMPVQTSGAGGARQG
jgi:membrane fusion protein (multidrug efflux system)